MNGNELQVKGKQELKTGTESTRNVPIFVPAVDIYETESALTLVADMPGASMETITIDLNNDQLTIKGTAALEDGNGKVVLREYAVGDYYRQFTLSNAIDREKIEASLRDGVLRVVLPKVEAAKPRRITVKTS